MSSTRLLAGAAAAIVALFALTAGVAVATTLITTSHTDATSRSTTKGDGS